MARGLLVLLLILSLETVHGILRGIVLVPRIGERLSGLVGWPIAMIIVLIVSVRLIGWTKVTGMAALLRLGAVWAVLTCAFEISIGILRGLEAGRIWAEINPLSGGLMLYSLIVMLLAPLFATWLRRSDHLKAGFAEMRRPALGRLITYGLLGLWSLVCLFPLYWLFVTSLKTGADVATGPRFLPFVDFTPVLDAWRFILIQSSDKLLPRFINSCLVASAAAALALLAGAMAVYALTRFRFHLPWARSVPANGLMMTGFLATRLLPPVVLVLPLYMMAQATSLLDTRLALIITYAAYNLPVAIWLLQPVFGSRRSEQEEAALLDGASHWSIFFTIVLPMFAGGIAAAGVLVFILCMNEYLFAAYLASDQAMTLPPWIAGQIAIREGQVASPEEEWANFSAASVLLIAPLLLFGGFVQRVLGRTARWKL